MSLSGDSDQKTAIANLELYLDDFFERDFLRFKTRHSRARAEAGPSLMGGPRGIDRWTYGHVRQHIDDCLRESSLVVLGFGLDRLSDPSDGERLLRHRLRNHFDAIFSYLEEDRTDGSAHEYGVLPSREALAAVRRYAEYNTLPALEAVARGTIDPRLEPRFGLFARAANLAGGTDRLVLFLAFFVFLLSMWAVL
jgi:hypothetical protein